MAATRAGFLKFVLIRFLGSSNRLENSYNLARGFVPAPNNSGVDEIVANLTCDYVPEVFAFCNVRNCFSLCACRFCRLNFFCIGAKGASILGRD